MRLVGWSKAFEDHKTFGDVPAMVRKTEIAYWAGVLFSIGLTVLGIAVMLSAPSGALKQMLFGSFLAVDGAISWAVIKMWVHVRLAMYWIIWDAQKRQNKETTMATNKTDEPRACRNVAVFRGRSGPGFAPA